MRRYYITRNGETKRTLWGWILKIKISLVDVYWKIHDCVMALELKTGLRKPFSEFYEENKELFDSVLAEINNEEDE